MTLMIKRRGLSLTAIVVVALGCTPDERLVRQAEERANGKLTKIVKSLVRTRNFPRRLNSS